MKRYLLALSALMLTLAVAAGTPAVSRIDPPHWWTGMADHSLQLQIYGSDIRPAIPSVDYPGVTIDSVARLNGSPNWQYIYLNISPEAKPGKMKITWTLGKKKVSRNYELRARTHNGGAQGFTSADVLYMVMPDRFADGDPANNQVNSMRFPVGADRANLNRRHGGDLKGILDHLDYIDSLGITALWLNPVLENDMPDGSYHGYAVTDYYRVDPRFGSNDDYRRLTDSLHSRGIKVVMDMIFNHSGSEHPWMLEPPSTDWFNFGGQYVQTNHKLATVTDPYASDYDRQMATDGWFVNTMPDLNQRNPHLMRYLSQNSIWWIEQGAIDGIRMDTYPYADKQAMAAWIADVERQYPDFAIVGECWFAEPAIEASWQRGAKYPAGGVDSNLPIVMDFPFMIKSRGLKNFTDATDEWQSGLVNFYNHFGLDYLYANPQKLLRFLDNHDAERVLLQQPENLDAWKQAVTMLLTVPGIPQIYYGTELLMSGDRTPGDGNVRRDVPGGFPGDSVNVFSASGRSALQREAYSFLSRLLQWRKNAEAVHEGGMKHFAPYSGVYIYQRQSPDTQREVIVVLNGTDEPQELDMSRYAEIIPAGAEYRDVLSGETLVLRRADGSKSSFAPRQTLVLEPLTQVAR